MKPLSEADAAFHRLMKDASPLERALAKAATSTALAIRADSAPLHLRTDILMAALDCYKHELMEAIGILILGTERERLTDQQSVARFARLCLASCEEAPRASKRLLNLCEALASYLPKEQK